MKKKALAVNYFIFPFMLILPGMALMRIIQSVDPIIVAGYLTAISTVTALGYRSDKKRAESNAWRIPERTLHVYEMLGGWTAAFFAQRVFRHKISKKEYQCGYWLIGVSHQYMAFDYLQNWKCAKVAVALIEPILK